MPDTMRAIVLDAPGPPDALTIRELPVPTPAAGWVPTLPDTLRSTRQHGVVCFTGMLSNVWTVRDFYPIDYLPRGVRLTAYHGEAEDLPQPVLQEFLDAVADGHAVVPIDRVYGFDQIVEAHAAMEAGGAAGKLVVMI